MAQLESFINELQSEIKKTLAPLQPQSGDLAPLAGALDVLKQVIKRLRDFVASYTFADTAEEIRFFKEIKPVLASQYIFHQEIYNIRVRSCFHSNDELIALLQHRLRRCQNYLVRHQEFYHYCLSNATHLDSQYFTRGTNRMEDMNADPVFTTSHDRILSQMVATQLIGDFLTNWIIAVRNLPSPSTTSLKWTGSKTDLTELIYALQAAEVFNNGSADIKQIASAFESMTGIQLGDYYRTFQAIQVRKNNQLVFITRLKDRMQTRLDDSV